MPDTSIAKRRGKLSAIVPTYNHGRLLPRAIFGLLAQTSPPDEIIVVDDASTDDTASALQRIGQVEKNRLRILRNDRNMGVVPTLIRGLQAASGEFIYFGAADDETFPNFFSSAMAALACHPQLGLFCGETLLVNEASGELYGIRPAVRPKLYGGAIPPARVRQLLRGSDNWILTGSAVLRREAIMEAGGLKTELGTFADGFLVRKIALTKGFYFQHSLVAKCFIYPQSASRLTASDLERARRTLRSVPDHLLADDCFPAWYGRKFSDRWRFGVSKLALEQNPLDLPLLLEIGARSSFDTCVLRLVSKIPISFLRKIIGLTWLGVRLRPYHLSRLGLTFLARLFSAQRPPKMTASGPEIRSAEGGLW